MSSIIEQLNDIQKRIDQARINKAQAEGRLGLIKRQLKKDFNVSTIKEAQALASSLLTDLNKQKEELERLLSTLEKKVPDET